MALMVAKSVPTGQGIDSRRHGARLEVHRRNVVGAWHLVVHERAADELARLRVVGDDLASRPARQSPSPRRLQKHAKKSGPLLRRHYPASTLIRPCPTPAVVATCRVVEAATLTLTGLPRYPNHPFRMPYPLPSRSPATGPIDNFPQVFRAFGAHCHNEISTFRSRPSSSA
jgi:hypothetical protein